MRVSSVSGARRSLRRNAVLGAVEKLIGRDEGSSGVASRISAWVDLFSEHAHVSTMPPLSQEVVDAIIANKTYDPPTQIPFGNSHSITVFKEISPAEAHGFTIGGKLWFNMRAGRR